MIHVHINPAGVERVVFAPESELEEDFDLAAWVAIRPLVNRIDKTLKKSAHEFLRTARPQREASHDRPA